MHRMSHKASKSHRIMSIIDVAGQHICTAIVDKASLTRWYKEQIMTSLNIIIGSILLTCAVIGFIFITQSIAKRKRERARLFDALKKRSKELLQMLNAFPPHFLPKEISVFLYRCIVDVFEQLSKLEPGRPELLEQFMLHTTAMEMMIRQPANTKQVNLKNTTQINEIRQYLNYLGRFMQKWQQRGNISSTQYAAYRLVLKNLVTRLMIDNYMLAATKSLDIGKIKLAVHYLTLAKNVIVKEGQTNTQSDNITHINKELIRLKESLKLKAAAEDEIQADITVPVETDGERKNALGANDDWKKKNVYD